jgi:NADPH:quinone reductase-like Zn-dependent oxidoreductase
LVDLLEPLTDKTVLIVGAGGGVGSFATQFAVNAGGNVIANVRLKDAERMRAYGATETIDHTEVSLVDAVRQAHPDGIDALLDLVSNASSFAALAPITKCLWTRPAPRASIALRRPDPTACGRARSAAA